MISEKGKLKEVGKLFLWWEQAIELQKEKEDLANRREAAGEENEKDVISLLEEKGEITNWQSKIKKLSENLNESEVKEFITGRSKSTQEMGTQIGRLAGKFQELERNQVPTPEENEFREIEDLEQHPPESDDSVEVEIPPIVNYPQKKRRKKAEPLEVKIDSGGKYSFANMLRSNLEESNEANAVLRGEFSQQEDVKLYSQLPDYDNFREYDLGIDEQLECASTLIFANFHKPPWRTLKHHLSTGKFPRKLFRELSFWQKMVRKTSLNKNGCLEE